MTAKVGNYGVCILDGSRVSNETVTIHWYDTESKAKQSAEFMVQTSSRCKIAIVKVEQIVSAKIIIEYTT